jgi:hypothetical protein
VSFTTRNPSQLDSIVSLFFTLYRSRIEFESFAYILNLKLHIFSSVCHRFGSGKNGFQLFFLLLDSCSCLLLAIKMQKDAEEEKTLRDENRSEIYYSREDFSSSRPFHPPQNIEMEAIFPEAKHFLCTLCCELIKRRWRGKERVVLRNS